MDCRRGRHRLDTLRLTLRHPTTVDLRVAYAAASDGDAQRWLGWRPETLARVGRRDVLLLRRPGSGRPAKSLDSWLVAIDPESNRLAGAVVVSRDLTVGGWLAPQFRGHGLGAELFGGAITLAHEHLGIETVLAGTERANSSCAGALTAAGFEPIDGPAKHTLPDGRVVPTIWFRHDTDWPVRCGRHLIRYA